MINKIKRSIKRFSETLAIKKQKLLLTSHSLRYRLCDTQGEFIDVAIKVIIGVVIGGLVLTGLYFLFDGIIMPRLNTEVNDMFNT